MKLANFEWIVDLVPKSDIEDDLVDTSVKRMDKAFELADFYILGIVNQIEDAVYDLKRVYRDLVNGKTSVKVVAQMANSGADNYQEITGIVYPFDRINALSSSLTKRVALEALVDTHAWIITQECISELLAVMYILHDNMYYRQLYDVQRLTGLAFDIDQNDTQSHIDELNKNADEVTSYCETVISDLYALVIDSFNEAGYDKDNLNIIVPDIKDAVDYGTYAVGRLVHTETTNAVTDAEIKAMDYMAIEMYRYITEMDSKVCEICKSLNLLKFPVRDKKIGENAPPMHPNCRCQIIPIVSSTALEHMKMSASKMPFVFSHVPRDMGYADWLKSWGIVIDEPMEF
jgi:SPP1 gp7 family putative phage head morphogenesis protein